VASPVPTTAGMPYSRATIAACDIDPPMSDTAALILANTGAQDGAVTGQTRISPSRSSPIWFTSVSTRALPSTTPDEAATPTSSSAGGVSQEFIPPSVVPPRQRAPRAVRAAGAPPRAGGGDP